jgi:hypothetical protein
MNFQKNPSNARRDEAEKELCYSRKVPLIVFVIATKLTKYVRPAHKVRVVNFQENDHNRSQDKTEKGVFLRVTFS